MHAATGLQFSRLFISQLRLVAQIGDEINALFDFMQYTYGLFGFEFSLELSTRPEKFLGSIETWDTAEAVCLFSCPALTNLTDALQQLSKALDERYPGKWDLNPGDGAFYGPKIDITIRDALRRSFQCATIQLDFQLPERFNLKYRSAEEGSNSDKPPSRPVIIHRAILGSLERFIAIITEHFAGKW